MARFVHERVLYTARHNTYKSAGGSTYPSHSECAGKTKKPDAARLRFIRFNMATLTGLEPATSAVTGRRANQLRHRAVLPTGFEPVLPP